MIIYLGSGLLRTLKRPYPAGHPMNTDRSEQLLVPALFGLAPRRDCLVSPSRFYTRDSSLWLYVPGQWPGMVGFFIEKPRPFLAFRRTAVSRYAALRSSDFPPPDKSGSDHPVLLTYFILSPDRLLCWRAYPLPCSWSGQYVLFRKI